MKPKLFRTSTVPLSLNVLLKGQLKFLNKHFAVTAVSGSGKDLEEVRKREGVAIKEIEMQRQISPFKDLVSLIRLFRYFKTEKPDIVHSITPKGGLLSMLAAKAARVPIRMHTYTGLIFPSKTGFMQKLLIQMDKLLCWAATHVYPEGEGVKKDLVNYKITSKPLKIIANGNVNGIDTDFFNPQKVSASQRAAMKKKLNLKNEDFVFLFIGRLVGDKGLNELVKAFEKISLSHKNAHLILVGPQEPELDPLPKETRDALIDQPHIHTTGFQSNVRDYYALADVLVFPSYREGFPNVVLQAGAMELNAIVTDINGSNEIIEEGKNGWIVPVKNPEMLAERMIWCLQNPEKSKQMGKRSRVLIQQKFEQHLVWEALLKEYVSVVGR